MLDVMSGSFIVEKMRKGGGSPVPRDHKAALTLNSTRVDVEADVCHLGKL